MVAVYISSCLFVVKAKSPSKTRRQFAPPYCSRISRHAAQEVRTRSHINLVIRLLGGLGTAWHIHDAMAANKIIRSRLVLELVAKIRSGGSSCLPRRREKGGGGATGREGDSRLRASAGAATEISEAASNMGKASAGAAMALPRRCRRSGGRSLTPFPPLERVESCGQSPQHRPMQGEVGEGKKRGNSDDD